MALAVFGAPVSAGAYAPGQEKAPQALREAGLIEALRIAGADAVDLGDTPAFRWKPDRTTPQAMNAADVAQNAAAVAERLRPALQRGDRALVLGGDCTIELGVVAAAGDVGSFGLVYFDLDTDLNTPASVRDGALDWMGVAHMLAIDGVDARVAGAFKRQPLLDPAQLLFFSNGSGTAFERETIERLAIAEVKLDEVQQDARSAAARAVEWASRFDRMLVHLDVDVLDYAKFRLAEHTRRGIGLDYEQLLEALEVLLAAPNWAVLTITELNPDHVSSDQDLNRFVGDLAAILT